MEARNTPHDDLEYYDSDACMAAKVRVVLRDRSSTKYFSWVYATIDVKSDLSDSLSLSLIF